MTTTMMMNVYGLCVCESCLIDCLIIMILFVGMWDDESGGVGVNVGVARIAATGFGGGARGRRRGRRRG